MKGLFSSLIVLAILAVPFLGFAEDPTPPPDEGEVKSTKWEPPVVQQYDDESGTPVDEDESATEE